MGRMRRMRRCWTFVLVLSLVLMATACKGAEEASQEKNTTYDPSGEKESPDPSRAKVGDVITFGSYEQDNDLAGGKEPIEWIVLDCLQDGELFLISKYALDCRPFHTVRVSVSWETCELNKWLNSTFLHTAFTQDEIERIVPPQLDGREASASETGGEKDTENRVFLLSTIEARTLFPEETKGNSELRKCELTEYAKAQGAGAFNDGSCKWWLRSFGDDTTNAAYVGVGGQIYNFGRIVSREDGAVRPAIIIKTR